MRYTDLIDAVSKELNIPVEVVSKAYRSYWEFIKETIQALPLKEDINEEEFSNLRTNFNLPSLGKLVCTFDKVQRVKRRFKYAKGIKENAESKQD